MEEPPRQEKRSWSWTAAVAGGAMAGLVCFGLAISSLIPAGASAKVDAPAQSASEPVPAPALELPPSVLRPVADYIRAYRENDCETIIALTAWMQRRLDRASLQERGAEAYAAAKADLCRQVTSRPVEGNHLRAEGIEDSYVLTPSAAVALLSADDGPDDLSEPVAKRVWLEVRYPDRGRALRDRNGLPISSIRVGVNVSRDGRVIKAGVIGTLELDLSSASYDWPLG